MRRVAVFGERADDELGDERIVVDDQHSTVRPHERSHDECVPSKKRTGHEMRTYGKQIVVVRLRPYGAARTRHSAEDPVGAAHGPSARVHSVRRGRPTARSTSTRKEAD